MWERIQEFWLEIRNFFDRVIGWIYYVLGEDDDPYVYETFHSNVYDN